MNNLSSNFGILYSEIMGCQFKNHLKTVMFAQSLVYVTLNPESVILNVVQNLFRAGSFQHLKSIQYEAMFPLSEFKKEI